MFSCSLSGRAASVPRGGKDVDIERMGTARPLDDRVVRACDGARPLLQQPSEPMQVGGEDRDTHGAFEACPAMCAHPVQAMAFQRMDRRFHARMLPASRHE